VWVFLERQPHGLETGLVVAGQVALEQGGSDHLGLHGNGRRNVTPDWRRLLERLRVVNRQSLEISLLAGQSENVEEHQPQALARSGVVQARRSLEQFADGLILAVGEKHRRLFGLGIDRIDFDLDLELGGDLAEDELAEFQWRRAGVGHRRGEGQIGSGQTNRCRGRRFLFFRRLPA